jgi:hypothetical protein
MSMEHEAAADRQDNALTLRVSELEQELERTRLGLMRIKTMAIGQGVFRIADIADQLLAAKTPGVSEK